MSTSYNSASSPNKVPLNASMDDIYIRGWDVHTAANFSNVQVRTSIPKELIRSLPEIKRKYKSLSREEFYKAVDMAIDPLRPRKEFQFYQAGNTIGIIDYRGKDYYQIEKLMFDVTNLYYYTLKNELEQIVAERHMVYRPHIDKITQIARTFARDLKEQVEGIRNLTVYYDLALMLATGKRYKNLLRSILHPDLNEQWENAKTPDDALGLFAISAAIDPVYEDKPFTTVDDFFNLVSSGKIIVVKRYTTATISLKTFDADYCQPLAKMMLMLKTMMKEYNRLTKEKYKTPKCIFTGSTQCKYVAVNLFKGFGVRNDLYDDFIENRFAVDYDGSIVFTKGYYNEDLANIKFNEEYDQENSIIPDFMYSHRLATIVPADLD